MIVPFGEMFSGIGGFRIGLEKASQISVDSQQRIRNPKGRCEPFVEGSDGRQFKEFRCVWANDNDKYACQIYRKHFGQKELVEGDIRTIDPSTIPDFDLLTAGFPCQSFSLAGKRKGFQDIRGTLFHEVIRVAGIKRPKLLLLENVKGLLSNDEGRTFGTILEELGRIGYWCEWQTLNSKYFGVPQNRERVFIVGHFRAKSSRQIFPIRTSDNNNDELGGTSEEEQQRVSSSDISPALRVGEKWSCFISPTLSAGYYKRQHGQISVMRYVRTEEAKAVRRQNMQNGKDDTPFGEGFRELVPSEEDFSGCLTGVLNKDSLVGLPQRPMIANALDCDGYLRDTSHHDKSISHYRIRRLTPVECERLQGFPDGFTEGISDTQRYKLLGNAVTANVIAFLGQKLLGDSA